MLQKDTLPYLPTRYLSIEQTTKNRQPNPAPLGLFQLPLIALPSKPLKYLNFLLVTARS